MRSRAVFKFVTSELVGDILPRKIRTKRTQHIGGQWLQSAIKQTSWEPSKVKPEEGARVPGACDGSSGAINLR